MNLYIDNEASLAEVAAEEAAEASSAPDETVPFRDRFWSSRALVASALASAIIGGLGGAFVVHAGESQSSDRGGPGMGQGPGGQGGFPGGPPPGAQSSSTTSN